MNKQALGVVLGAGLLSLVKSKISGSTSTIVDLFLQKKLKIDPIRFKNLYNGYSLNVRFTINVKPIIDETINKDGMEWDNWFLTQPGFFSDGIGLFRSMNFSESVRKKYSDKIRSQDKHLGKFETLYTITNKDIMSKKITVVNPRWWDGNIKEKEISGIGWVGEMDIVIRLPFLDRKTTSKDLAEMIKNELLTISEIAVNEMNQKIIDEEKNHNVETGVRFELDSIEIPTRSIDRRRSVSRADIEFMDEFKDQNKPFQDSFLNPNMAEILFKEGPIYFFAYALFIQGTQWGANQLDMEYREFYPQLGPQFLRYGDIRKAFQQPKSKLRRR